MIVVDRPGVLVMLEGDQRQRLTLSISDPLRGTFVHVTLERADVDALREALA